MPVRIQTAKPYEILGALTLTGYENI
jgi:hypothetical protein